MNMAKRVGPVKSARSPAPLSSATLSTQSPLSVKPTQSQWFPTDVTQPQSQPNIPINTAINTLITKPVHTGIFLKPYGAVSKPFIPKQLEAAYSEFSAITSFIEAQADDGYRDLVLTAQHPMIDSHNALLNSVVHSHSHLSHGIAHSYLDSLQRQAHFCLTLPQAVLKSGKNPIKRSQQERLTAERQHYQHSATITVMRALEQMMFSLASTQMNTQLGTFISEQVAKGDVSPCHLKPESLVTPQLQLAKPRYRPQASPKNQYPGDLIKGSFNMSSLDGNKGVSGTSDISGINSTDPEPAPSPAAKPHKSSRGDASASALPGSSNPMFEGRDTEGHWSLFMGMRLGSAHFNTVLTRLWQQACQDALAVLQARACLAHHIAIPEHLLTSHDTSQHTPHEASLGRHYNIDGFSIEPFIRSHKAGYVVRHNGGDYGALHANYPRQYDVRSGYTHAIAATHEEPPLCEWFHTDGAAILDYNPTSHTSHTSPTHAADQPDSESYEMATNAP
jgi:hypothetical protein